MMVEELTPLEVAVTTALSQDPLVSNQVRGEAQRFCDAFRNNPDGWRIGCEQFIRRSKFPDKLLAASASVANVNDWLIELRFWYIQSIADSVSGFGTHDRVSVRSFLFMYLEDILLWRATTFITAAASAAQQESFNGQPREKIGVGSFALVIAAADHPAVLAKLALLYVRCLVADYPDSWPEGVSALFKLWSKHHDAYHQVVASKTPMAKNHHHHHNRQDFYDGNPSELASPEVGLSELVALQHYITMTQFLFSMMEAFDDEVVTEIISRPQKEKNRNMEVKDALRDGDVLLFADAWAKVLHDFGNSNTSGQIAPTVKIVSRCLQVISRYVGWIDIQIIANQEKFLGEAFSLFHRRNENAPSVMELIGAILRKRMDSAQRIIIIHKLKLLDEVLDRLTLEDVAGSTTVTSSASSEDTATVGTASDSRSTNPANYMTDVKVDDPDLYSLKISELLNLIGEQLLASFVDLRSGYEPTSVEDDQDLRRLGGVRAVGPNPFFTPITTTEFWSRLQQEAWGMLYRLLPKVCLVYSHPHPSIAASVEPFLSELLKQLRHFLFADSNQPFRPPPHPLTSPLCPLYVPIATVRPILLSLFQMTLARVQYPYWFNVATVEENQLQESFSEFRQDITLLFKRLYSVDETTSYLFLQSVCQQLRSAMCQTVHVNQVEAVLHLVVTAGETYRDVSKELTHFDSPLAECLRSLFSSTQLLHHPHPQIRILLFQLLIRYMPFFQQRMLHPTENYYVATVLDLLLSSWDNVTAEGAENVATAPELSAAGQQSGAVLSHSILALLRFVKSNLKSVGPFIEQIFNKLSSTKLLAVKYFPSSDWTVELPSKPTHQCDASSASKLLSSPSGFPNELWKCDDQNRCYEIAGYLIGSFSASVTGYQRVSLLSRLMDPLLEPIEELSSLSTQPTSTESGSYGSNKLLHRLSQTDPRGSIDFVARLLQACANLSKGINVSEEFFPLWLRCLESELLVLQYFGLDCKVRSAVVLLTRRMITLLKPSPNLLPSLTTLCPIIFDMTFSSFAQCHAINEDELRECIQRESVNEQEYKAAEVALTLAKQRLCQLGQSIRSFSSSPVIPATFSSHQEISQLCLVLDFIIVTFKGNLASEFLLFKLAEYYSPLPLSSATQPQHLFVRLFNQLMDYWRLMPSGSPQLQREKNEIHRDMFSILYTVAQHSPSTLLTLFEEEISDSSKNSTETPLLSCLATGAHPKYLHSLAAVTVCIQTWTALIVYAFSFSDMIENTYRIDMESFLFDRLKLSLLMHHVIQFAFLLDMENPQHGKTLQEICTLLRLFSGFLPNASEAASLSQSCRQPQLISRVRRAFLDSIPFNVCSPQDATLVLQAIAEAPTAKEAKEVLRKWIGSQQLSSRENSF